MADEEQDQSQKTEEPTERRLQKARGEGDSPHSKDLNHLVMLSGVGLVFLFYFPMMFDKIKLHLLPFIANADGLDWKVLDDIFIPLLFYASLPICFLFGLAIAVGLYQNKMHFKKDAVVPKFTNVSFAKGFARIFSMRNVFDFIKSLIYVIIIIYFIGQIAYSFITHSDRLVWFDLPKLLQLAFDQIWYTLLGVIIVVGVFAAFDMLYQYFDYRKRMRMTQQEVKDEHKESDGDPLIKSRIKRLQYERAKRRMMAAVQQADVVITNPTHYAVALKYDENTMSAPVVVAKGIDMVAQRIREVAAEHRVYITRNPPLARALYKVELDQEIPSEHYKAVAEIIIYVMKLKQKWV